LPAFDPPPTDIGADKLYPGPCMEELHLWRSGNVVSRTTTTYDGQGQPIRVDLDKVIDGVRGLDGQSESTRILTYNKKGQLESEDKENHDSDTAAWWNTRTKNAYDRTGRVKTKSHDRQMNGTVDYITKFIYKKDRSLVVEETRSKTDKNLLSRSTRVLDASGRPQRQEEDADADGKPDSVWTFIYDDSGNLVTEENDRDADGSVDTVTRRTFGEHGLLLQEKTDLDGDGNPDITVLYTYDSFGNALSKSTQQSRTLFSYDCWR
jgi:hypothetical protein